MTASFRKEMGIILERVIVDPHTGCWNWSKSKIRGYGRCVRVVDNIKFVFAHRLSFYLAYGLYPEFCCHRCNNPSCCNPEHLYSGTHQDNMRDLAQANKNDEKVSKNGFFMRDQVLLMRELHASRQKTTIQLAKMFNVPLCTMKDIISKRSYIHI